MKFDTAIEALQKQKEHLLDEVYWLTQRIEDMEVDLSSCRGALEKTNTEILKLDQAINQLQAST